MWPQSVHLFYCNNQQFLYLFLSIYISYLSRIVTSEFSLTLLYLFNYQSLPLSIYLIMILSIYISYFLSKYLIFYLGMWRQSVHILYCCNHQLLDSFINSSSFHNKVREMFSVSQKIQKKIYIVCLKKTRTKSCP